MRMTQHSINRALLGVLSLFCVGCADAPDLDVERRVDASSRSIRAAAHSNLSLSSKLASALRDEPGNLFYSPLSIEAVTGLLLAGAAGDTAAQLSMLLDAQDDPDMLHEGLGALLQDLTHQNLHYRLSIANRIWAAPGLMSSDNFVATSRDDYNAPIFRIDMMSNPEAARAEINGWVSDQTENKIPELLESGQITPQTVMALANAIYFKANWATAFDASRTRTATFHKADSTDVPVEMMTTPGTRLRTAFIDQGTWLELPYRTGDVSFLAYSRPPSNHGDPVLSVQALHDDLQDVNLNEVVERLQEEKLIAQLPRFSMRTRLDLIAVFQRLGVTDLFDPTKVDLRNLSIHGAQGIDPFVHEAAVWIDELGTVAAAATAAGVLRSGPRTVTFDHPFLFFIRDNRTGAILFTGRVADPTADAAD